MAESTLEGTFTLLEILAMPSNQQQQILRGVRIKISELKAKLNDLEATERSLTSDDFMDNELNEPEEATSSDIKSARFNGITQEEAVETLLKEHPGKVWTSAQIARGIVREGWGNGRKTGKQIKSSINSILSRGASEGKYKNVERGKWMISHPVSITLHNGHAQDL